MRVLKAVVGFVGLSIFPKPAFALPKEVTRRSRSAFAIRLLPLLLLLMLPAKVQGQFSYTDNGDGTVTITGYTGSGDAVTIPSSTNGLLVTSIGEWAFYNTSVTNVLIPDTVTNIADGAFFDCEALASATLGASVTSIGDWTFAFCSSLASVCCPGNTPSLGGTNVFYGCGATVYYLPGTANWASTFGGLSTVLWNPPVPYNYTTNGETITITRYTGSGGSVAIPSTINFLPVTGIGESAFYVLGVTNVLIPDSVTNIEDGAFRFCLNLTNITVASLNSFYSSTNGVLFDRGQTTLIQFPRGKVGSYTIPNSVTSIGSYVFSYCSLTRVTIPNSVTNIEGYAFFNCSRPDQRDDPQQPHQHRGLRVHGLHQPDQHHDPQQRDHNRGLGALWLHQPG